MTTTVSRPTLQDAGDVCQSCLPFWRAQNLPPSRMVSLGKYTENRAVEIVVCPHCDGDTILRLNH